VRADRFVDAVRGLVAFIQREQGEFVDLVYRGP
jgi:hypothetical protein